MSPEEFLSLLEALQLMSPRQRRAFFTLATAKQMRTLEEACYNLVKNSKFKSKELNALAKTHGNSIKVLADRSKPKALKRKLLIQKGGFLGAVLPVIASIVMSLISR